MLNTNQSHVQSFKFKTIHKRISTLDHLLECLLGPFIVSNPYHRDYSMQILIMIYGLYLLVTFNQTE